MVVAWLIGGIGLAGMPVAVLLAMVPVGVLVGVCYVSHQASSPVVALRCRHDWVLVARIAATVIAAGCVLGGLVVLLGATGFALAFVGAGTAIAWRAGRSHRAPIGRSRQRDVPPPTPPATLAVIPTAELSRMWRVSYLTLAGDRDPGVVDHVTLARRRYLDELERRDPTGFQRWITAGARAASDPARYIPG